MTGTPPSGAIHEGISKGVKAVLVVMLLILLLPATVMTLPLSELSITVANPEESDPASVTIYIYGGSDLSASFMILPGEEHTELWSLRSGTHDIMVSYWYPDDPYYGDHFWDSVTLWPFESEEMYVVLHFY